MTKSVADETLGKIARQQNDLFRRVREGSLDPEVVSVKLQEIIEWRNRLTVDFGLSLEEMIVAGHYDWINSDINERFPLTGKGVEEYEYKIFHFDRNISSDEADRLIAEDDAENPWSSAPIWCLLAYGAKCPEEQRKYPIVGLGSSCQIDRYCFVPYLYGDCSERGLSLSGRDFGWDDLYRFLAVRKKKPCAA